MNSFFRISLEKKNYRKTYSTENTIIQIHNSASSVFTFTWSFLSYAMECLKRIIQGKEIHNNVYKEYEIWTYSMSLSAHLLISFLYFHIVKKTKWSNQTPDNFVIKTKKKIKKKISKLFINISISPYLNINAQICDLKYLEPNQR